MLSKWEKQDSIIDITCHEQSATRDHTWRDCLLFWDNLIMSNQKSYSVPEIKMNSNSHFAAYSYSNKGKEQLKNIKTWNHWQSSFVSNIDGNYGNLWKSLQFFSISDPRVDLPEPTAISKSCQRLKRNSWARHLHVSSPTTLRYKSLLLNWRSFSPHKSHLRRGGRTWYPDFNWNCTGLGH